MLTRRPKGWSRGRGNEPRTNLDAARVPRHTRDLRPRPFPGKPTRSSGDMLAGDECMTLIAGSRSKTASPGGPDGLCPSSHLLRETRVVLSGGRQSESLPAESDIATVRHISARGCSGGCHDEIVVSPNRGCRWAVGARGPLIVGVGRSPGD